MKFLAIALSVIAAQASIAERRNSKRSLQNVDGDNHQKNNKYTEYGPYDPDLCGQPGQLCCHSVDEGPDLAPCLYGLGCDYNTQLPEFEIGVCTPQCGGAGQPCCNSVLSTSGESTCECDTGLVYNVTSHTCTPCGGVGQPCCCDSSNFDKLVQLAAYTGGGTELLSLISSNENQCVSGCAADLTLPTVCNGNNSTSTYDCGPRLPNYCDSDGFCKTYYPFISGVTGYDAVDFTYASGTTSSTAGQGACTAQAAGNGVCTAECDGNAVGYFNQDDYVGYENVDFGNYNTYNFIDVVYGKGGGAGTVTVHLDSPTGDVIATFIPTNTGAWCSAETAEIPITVSVQGNHDVYFKTDQGDVWNFHSWNLARKNVPTVLNNWPIYSF